jgi:hypothetical protein
MYFQHLIVANINNTKAFSIMPKMYKDFKDYISPYKNININEMLRVLKVFFDGRFEKYSIRKMYRMTLKKMPKDLILDIAVKLTREI